MLPGARLPHSSTVTGTRQPGLLLTQAVTQRLLHSANVLRKKEKGTS